MPWTDKDYIKLSEVYQAYRKAKTEAFSDTNCAHGLKFALYEQDLSNNLRRLLQALNRKRSVWATDIGFIGAVTCIPKSITPPDGTNGDSKIHCESSNPLGQWAKNIRLHGLAKAEFRPVIDATVDYMVVSALWVLKVGSIHDDQLDVRHAMGSRLRRWRPKQGLLPGIPGRLNWRSPNLFAPYFVAYGQWRNRGLQAMKSELKQGHRIAAITMDLKRFYHRVDASFLVHPAYADELSFYQSEDDVTFTRLLLASFSTWNAAAAAKFGCPATGVPVGLTASSVIANCLMREFDRCVVRELTPCYYGRYVDDVILVIRQEKEHDDGETLLREIADRLNPVLEFVETPDEGKALKVNLPYHPSVPGSELLFVTAKQKIFQLEGDHGLDLINPIEEQIRSQGSEYRNLPSLPTTEGGMASRALLVNSDAQLQTDALRKADAVTLRRSGFALLLGDIEAHARDVEANSWQELRNHFYGLIKRHLISPVTFFDLSRYLPRIFSVMISCRDWDRAEALLDGIRDLILTIRTTSYPESVLKGDQLAEAMGNLGKRFAEVIFQNRGVASTDLRPVLKRVREVFGLPSARPYSLGSIGENSEALLITDWSKESYAHHWFSSHALKTAFRPTPRDKSIREILPFEAIDILVAASGLPVPHWPAVAFAVRPVPVALLSARAPELLTQPKLFSKVVRGLRGVWMPKNPGFVVYPDPLRADGPERYFVPLRRTEHPKVVLTSLEVTDEQFKAAASGAPDLSLERYRNLHTLLNRAAKSKPKPDYVILPELAIPRPWMHSMAKKLLDRGVSLIGGVEYRPDPLDAGNLHNEAIIALRSDYPGYLTNFVVLQPKQAPAWKELVELQDTFGKRFAKRTKGAPDRPVYMHADFCFGVLICSELSDIANRLRFQGQVDALFVPEWNSDLDTFSALVESAAHDVHAYIAQANNRRYGDTRLRGPMKEHYERDLIRVKGGKNDYFVIAEINFQALRRFQSNDRPPVGKQDFKPFPIGFPQRLSHERRASWL